MSSLGTSIADAGKDMRYFVIASSPRNSAWTGRVLEVQLLGSSSTSKR
jgi:hypothetical protein